MTQPKKRPRKTTTELNSTFGNIHQAHKELEAMEERVKQIDLEARELFRDLIAITRIGDIYYRIGLDDRYYVVDRIEEDSIRLEARNKETDRILGSTTMDPDGHHPPYYFQRDPNNDN